MKKTLFAMKMIMAVLKNKTTTSNKIAIKKKVKKTSLKKKSKKKVERKKKLEKKIISKIKLERVVNNPIIKPTNENYWESKATFNPTALCHDGKVHILYRAVGESDNSVLGYAGSNDGFTISDHFPTPVYFHFIQKKSDTGLSPISYSSGGGWGGGCEDPRLTLLGDRVYMIYTAFDGWGSVRMAMTSISLDDFITKRWNWKEPVLISPPGEIHKNWVLFSREDKREVRHSSQCFS